MGTVEDTPGAAEPTPGGRGETRQASQVDEQRPSAAGDNDGKDAHTVATVTNQLALNRPTLKPPVRVLGGSMSVNA